MEAKTRLGVSFVPALLKTLENDLKQQPVYQNSPKDDLSDFSLETDWRSCWSFHSLQTKTLKIFLNNSSSVRSCIIIHQNEVTANCTSIRVDIWIKNLIPLCHTYQSSSLEHMQLSVITE
ncbi:uncharacterized protein TNCV_3768701 [Trichonephila clavipes]|nr:uncharacterized protein TNCV_3768701 [Trichonephila clavipes]